MNDYSNYRKEFDPFSEHFDPVKALAEFNASAPFTSSSSIDEFERELIDNDETAELVRQLTVNIHSNFPIFSHFFRG